LGGFFVFNSSRTSGRKTLRYPLELLSGCQPICRAKNNINDYLLYKEPGFLFVRKAAFREELLPSGLFLSRYVLTIGCTGAKNKSHPQIRDGF
jgi:hypothetical protein